MPSSVRPATRADLPAIAATLAEAFVDDPVKRHLTGVAHVPPSRSLPFFDAFTRMQMPKGHVYVAEVDGEVRGAALWSPPGQWRVPTSAILRWGPRFVRMYGRRFPANLGVLKTVEKHHPHEPHRLRPQRSKGAQRLQPQLGRQVHRHLAHSGPQRRAGQRSCPGFRLCRSRRSG